MNQYETDVTYYYNMLMECYRNIDDISRAISELQTEEDNFDRRRDNLLHDLNLAYSSRNTYRSALKKVNQYVISEKIEYINEYVEEEYRSMHLQKMLENDYEIVI